MPEDKPYESFSKEDIENATHFLHGMHKEARDDTWRNGLTFEIGKLTVEKLRREEDEERNM